MQCTLASLDGHKIHSCICGGVRQAFRAVCTAGAFHAVLRRIPNVWQPVCHGPDRRSRKRCSCGSRPGVYRVRPLHCRSGAGECVRANVQQAAGLCAVEARDCGELRSGNHELRCAIQPVHDVSLQSLRRHAGFADLQIHGGVQPAGRSAGASVFAGVGFGRIRVHPTRAARAGVCSHSHGAVCGIRVRVLYHVQAHSPP